jgi:glutaredoxin
MPANHKLNQLLGRTLSVSILILLFNTPAIAEIYRWVDDNGKVNFSDQLPADVTATQLEIHIDAYTSALVDDADTNNAGSSRVIIYSASWCSVCKQARAWFEQENISFTEYDIEHSEKGRQDFKKLNGRGVPVILVGRKKLIGFSPASFEKIYQSRG